MAFFDVLLIFAGIFFGGLFGFAILGAIADTLELVDDPSAYLEARKAATAWIEREYGNRCSDPDEFCPACRKWAQFDALFTDEVRPELTDKIGR